MNITKNFIFIVLNLIYINVLINSVFMNESYIEIIK